jgi:hypothetical protein
MIRAVDHSFRNQCKRIGPNELTFRPVVLQYRPAQCGPAPSVAIARTAIQVDIDPRNGLPET